MTTPPSKRSKSTTHCQKCGKSVLRLERVDVEGAVLHESCFTCQACATQLTSSSYVAHQGAFFCIKHYYAELRKSKSFDAPLNLPDPAHASPRVIEIPGRPSSAKAGCAICHKRVFNVDGMSVRVDGKTIHRACFVCHDCQDYLTEENYHEDEGTYFCTAHYLRRADRSSRSSLRQSSGSLPSLSRKEPSHGSPLRTSSGETIRQRSQPETGSPKPTRLAQESAHRSRPPPSLSTTVDDNDNDDDDDDDGRGEDDDLLPLPRPVNLDHHHDGDDDNNDGGGDGDDGLQDRTLQVEGGVHSGADTDQVQPSHHENTQDTLIPHDHNHGGHDGLVDGMAHPTPPDDHQKDVHSHSHNPNHDQGAPNHDGDAQPTPPSEEPVPTQGTLENQHKGEGHGKEEEHQEEVKAKAQTKEEGEPRSTSGPTLPDSQESSPPPTQVQKTPSPSPPPTEHAPHTATPLPPPHSDAHPPPCTLALEEPLPPHTPSPPPSHAQSPTKSPAGPKRIAKDSPRPSAVSDTLPTPTEREGSEQSKSSSLGSRIKKKKRRTSSIRRSATEPSDERDKRKRKERKERRKLTDTTNHKDSSSSKKRKKRRKKETPGGDDKSDDLLPGLSEETSSHSTTTKEPRDSAALDPIDGGNVPLEAHPPKPSRTKSRRGIMKRFPRSRKSDAHKDLDVITQVLKVSPRGAGDDAGSGQEGNKSDGKEKSTLTSFVSGRWRKSKKDLGRMLGSKDRDKVVKSPPTTDDDASPLVSSPGLSPAPGRATSPRERPATVGFKAVEPVVEDLQGSTPSLLDPLSYVGEDDEDGEEHSGLSVVVLTDDGTTPRQEELRARDSSDDGESVLPARPLSLHMPVPFSSATAIPPCADLLECEPSIDALDLTTRGEPGPNRERDAFQGGPTPPAPIVVDLDAVVSEPDGPKETIRMRGLLHPPTIAICVVGMHRRLFNLLADLQRTHPHQLRVLAVSQVSPACVQFLQEHFGSQVSLASTEEVLQRADCSWLFLGMSATHTASIITQALQSGKNVFCERPLVLQLEPCVALHKAVGEAQAAGQYFLAGLVWREAPFYQQVRHLMGYLGDILSVEANHLLDVGEAGQLMCDPRATREQSGTLVMQCFLDDLDLLAWLLDSVPRWVSSFAGRDMFIPSRSPSGAKAMQAYMQWPAQPLDVVGMARNPFATGPSDIHDNQTIMLEYENHARVTLHTNTHSLMPQRRLLVCGTLGTLEAELYTGRIRYRRVGESECTTMEMGPGRAHGDADTKLMDAFLECALQGNTQFCCPGTALFPSIVTALAVDQAQAQKSVVSMESFPRSLLTPSIPPPASSS